MSEFFFLLYRDPQLLKRIGVASAREIRATGIPYAFAPCVAVTQPVLYVNYDK